MVLKLFTVCRDAKAAMSAIHFMLLPSASGALGHCAASEPAQGAAKRSNSSCLNDTALRSHPIVSLMGLAVENQLEKVHAVRTSHTSALSLIPDCDC